MNALLVSERPVEHIVAHFALAFNRVEKGQGEEKSVHYEATPQVVFRPERVLVRARMKTGWLERATGLLTWVKFPWLERRWVIPQVELDEDEIRAMLDSGELDDLDDDSRRLLEDLDALDEEDEDELNGVEIDDEEDLHEDVKPRKVWRVKWLRPFSAWRARIVSREQQERLRRCFVRDILVDGQGLLVPGHLVPITVFLELAIGTHISSPTCPAGRKIAVLLEGEVPELDITMIGLSPSID